MHLCHYVLSGHRHLPHEYQQNQGRVCTWRPRSGLDHGVPERRCNHRHCHHHVCWHLGPRQHVDRVELPVHGGDLLHVLQHAETMALLQHLHGTLLHTEYRVRGDGVTARHHQDQPALFGGRLDVRSGMLRSVRTHEHCQSIRWQLAVCVHLHWRTRLGLFNPAWIRVWELEVAEPDGPATRRGAEHELLLQDAERAVRDWVTWTV